MQPTQTGQTDMAAPGDAVTPTSLDVVEAFDDFMRSFEAFKDANDQRLAQIESQVSADVVTVEKMNRINGALDRQKALLDQLLHKARRPQLGDAYNVLPHANLHEHKQAFDHYIRKGETAGLSRIEAKAALSIGGTNADGGYLVPAQTEIEIGKRLADISPIRSIASVRQISNSTYKKPFAVTGPTVGWVGETEARTETDPTDLEELEFPAMELYAMPAATQTLLDDSAIDIDAWIADEVQVAFAEQESSAFVAGATTKKPKGFLSYTAVENSTWSWGNVGFVHSGASGGFAISDPSDALVDLVYALKAGYRQNAHWVMNRSTQAEIRKLKDSAGDYIWQPAAQPGAPAMLMNFPIVESEDMPPIGLDSLSIAFGDFKRGYLIVDRLGVRVLRDPYSSKPYVLFYITKRVGGGIQDFDAIKLMRFSAPI